MQGKQAHLTLKALVYIAPEEVVALGTRRRLAKRHQRPHVTAGALERARQSR